MWRDCGSIDEELAIQTILADKALTLQAIRYVVSVAARHQSNSLIREVALGDGHRKQKALGSAIVTALVDAGLSLLDVRFGSKVLGDYLPAELSSYVATQQQTALTMAARSAFLKAVVAECPDGTKVIRDQISAERVDAIRVRLIEKSPRPEMTEIALAVA